MGSLVFNIIFVGILIYLFFSLLKNRYLITIALRNIFRNTRRSIITLAAIGIGSTAITLFGGFISDMYYGLRESTIRSELGHLQIYQKGFTEFGLANPSSYRLYNFEQVKKTLMEDDFLKENIEALAPVIEFSGLVSSGETTKSFVGKGVDIMADRTLSTYDIILEGSKLDPDDQFYITMGELLARSLGVSVGEMVSLLVATETVGINVIDTVVRGTTRSFSSDYDKVFLKLPLKEAWDLLGEVYIDKYIVLLKNTEDFNEVVERLDRLMVETDINIEYRTWRNLAIFYKSVVRMYDGIFNFVKWIIFIIIIIFISNTLFMVVFERVNEIGTLRTLGTTKGLLIQNFVLESLLLGILGGLFGLILAWLIGSIINVFGIPMPPPPGSSSGYTAYIRFDKEIWSSFFFSFKLSLITALGASILPAKKSIDLIIVDALRHY